MNPVEISQGTSPIVLGLPHTGTYVPDEIAARLNVRGQGLDDTDWHIHRLYDGLIEGATTVRATFHRYVIDANRDPSGQSLYPGQNTTGLVPLTDFDGHDIWDLPPSDVDVETRRETFHMPYHKALKAELERVHALHGIAILYDCHSIRSNIPFLFNGTLPDFNIGTNMGTTCAPQIEQQTHELAAAADNYSCVLNGRFKGGWTTRHYGQPKTGIHAIQMELAQSTYLTSETAPWEYDERNAKPMRNRLTKILKAIEKTALEIRS